MTKDDKIQHKLAKTRTVYYQHHIFVAIMKINDLRIDFTRN